MKYRNGNYYVEVKDKGYIFNANETNLLKIRDQPKSLRTKHQVQNETEIRKNHKVIKNDNSELLVKNFFKKTTKYSAIKIYNT